MAESSTEQLKTLTIILGDLSIFSSAGEALPSEDREPILKASLDPLTEIIHQNSGMVISNSGECFTAAFGMDRSREDDPFRAAKAALTMQDALVSLAPKLGAGEGASLKMRIGLNTGLAKVMQIEGRADLAGDAVDLAARLAANAQESGILISNETYRHIRGLFDMRSREPITVKDNAKPMPVYELLTQRVRGIRIGTRGLAGLETQMIGRDAEFQRLTTAFMETVEERRPTMVTVVGEAGLGKSRLEFEFSKYLEELRYPVAYGKGASFPVNPMTLYPFHRIICDRAGIKDDEPKPSAQKKLEAMIAETMTAANPTGPAPAQIEDQCHFIAELIGFEYDESPYVKSLRGVDPQQVQMRGFNAFCKLFAQMADEDPLVLVFDDIHWADQPSLLLIEQLFTAVKDVPLLLLCLTRPEFYENRPAFYKSGEWRLHINILPLDVTNRRDFITHLLRHCAEIPDQVVNLIDGRSEGNPFFAEELVRMFIDHRVITRLPGGAWDIHPEKLNDSATPTTVEGVIQARFDTLDEIQQKILREAAVVGRIFWKEVLEYYAAANPAAAPSQKIATTLDSLGRVELVHRHFTTTLEDSEEYIFKHILIREAIYRNTLSKVRQVYHRLAGEWLEQQPETVVARFCDTIAHHFEQGEVWDKACSYYQRAGANAHSDNDLETGIRHYTSALKLVERMREAEAAEDLDHTEVEIRLTLDNLYNLEGKRELQERNLEAALTLSERSGDAEKEMRVLNKFSWLYHEIDQDNMSLEFAKKGLHVAQTIGHRRGSGESLNNIGLVYLNSSDYVQARVYLEQAIAVRREAGDRHGEADSLNNLAIAYDRVNDFAQALACHEQSLSIRRKIGDRGGEATSLNNIGVVLYGIGDYAQARAYFEQTLPIRREAVHRAREGLSLYNIATVSCLSGDYAYSLECYEQALSISKGIGNRRMESDSLRGIGYIHNAVGDYPMALASYEHAMSIIREIGDQRREASGLYSMGSAYSNTGEFAQALTCHEQALSIRKEMGDRRGEAEVLIKLGKIHLFQGEGEKAIEPLRRATSDLMDGLNDKPCIIKGNSWLGIACLKTDPEHALEYSQKSITLLSEMSGLPDELIQQIYWNHYQVLSAVDQEADANAAFQQAFDLVMEQADKMTNPAMRKSFLENVRVNQEILTAMAET